VTAEIDRRPVHGSVRHFPADIRRPHTEEAEPDHGLVRPFERTDPIDEPRIEVDAADLRVLFEEAAARLVRIIAPQANGGPAWRWETIHLRAVDLPTLAGLWLDRLIAVGDSRLADGRREIVVAVAVDVVSPPEHDPQFGRWQVRARVGLRPCLAGDADPRLPSPIDRQLVVESSDGGWALRVSLAG
jgi:hypothetical protein